MLSFNDFFFQWPEECLCRQPSANKGIRQLIFFFPTREDFTLYVPIYHSWSFSRVLLSNPWGQQECIVGQRKKWEEWSLNLGSSLEGAGDWSFFSLRRLHCRWEPDNVHTLAATTKRQMEEISCAAARTIWYWATFVSQFSLCTLSHITFSLKRKGTGFSPCRKHVIHYDTHWTQYTERTKGKCFVDIVSSSAKPSGPKYSTVWHVQKVMTNC